MRAALRPLLPALSAIYGLGWDDIVVMPRAELSAYIDQLDQWVSVTSGGVIEARGGR